MSKGNYQFSCQQHTSSSFIASKDEKQEDKSYHASKQGQPPKPRCQSFVKPKPEPEKLKSSNIKPKPQSPNQPQSQEAPYNNQDKEESANQIEAALLEAIKLIQTQTKVCIKNCDEAVVLLGKTGSGKSTIFNWLIGNELIVKKNPKRKAEWYVESENKTQKKKTISVIGHNQSSQTQTPVIGQSEKGTFIVDFPGWCDTRGWQQDLINQYLIGSAFKQFKKISIIFVCDYGLINQDRGIGIRDFVQEIKTFTQGAIIQKSAMLAITRLQMDSDEEDYIDDIRSICKEVLEQSKKQIDSESRTILQSISENSIFIMEKAGKYKQKYSDEEKEKFWSQIMQLQRVSLTLRPNFKKTIDYNFTKYLATAFEKRRIRLQFILKSIKEIIHMAIGKKNLESEFFQVNQDIDTFKKEVIQNPLNQLEKYEALERFYKKLTEVMQRKYYKDDESYSNLFEIYNYFYPFKNELTGYSMELINNQDLQAVFETETEIINILKNTMLLSQQEITKKKLENEKLMMELKKLKEDLQKMQIQTQKETTKMRIHLENQSRRWNPFKRPLIPDWVVDLDEYLELEDEKYKY